MPRGCHRPALHLARARDSWKPDHAAVAAPPKPPGAAAARQRAPIELCSVTGWAADLFPVRCHLQNFIHVDVDGTFLSLGLLGDFIAAAKPAIEPLTDLPRFSVVRARLVASMAAAGESTDDFYHQVTGLSLSSTAGISLLPRRCYQAVPTVHAVSEC